MSTETNKALVLDTWKALWRGDVDAGVANMSEDVTWTLPGAMSTSGVKRGQAEVARLRRQNLDVFVELDRKIVGVYADGNTVVIEAEAKGRLKNGKVYDNAGCSVWDIKDGKICSVREYVDTVKAAALSELYLSAAGQT
jgi:uncharacterized protein